ncbi:MAG: pyridoxal phosphate-dependent aminotransferase, partial [Byssovorax sp.]
MTELEMNVSEGLAEEAEPSIHRATEPSGLRSGEASGMGAFRKVPRTGVIYVMGEAARLGHRHGGEPGEDGWCNLGQ